VGMPAYVSPRSRYSTSRRGSATGSLPRPPSLATAAGTSFVEPSQRYLNRRKNENQQVEQWRKTGSVNHPGDRELSGTHW